MAYIKPPALTRRLASPIAMRLGMRGVATFCVLAGALASPTRFR